MRLVAFWLSKPRARRQTDEQQGIEAVTRSNGEIAAAEMIALQFRDLLAAQDPSKLAGWLHAVDISNIPELKTVFGETTMPLLQAFSTGGATERLKDKSTG